jgi:thymidylate synthase (FAD)
VRIVEPCATLVFMTPNAAQFIERAGRTCYKSEDLITLGSAATFCKKLKALGHLSVFEHAVATFRVVCDRGVSHEIVRHRIASYSQESTRYVDYGKTKHGGEIAVIRPPGIEPGNPDGSYETWVEAMEAAEHAYFALRDTGHPPQIARSVLPTCLKTEIVWTANFREWLEILRQRAQPPAHPQMVEIVGGYIKPALVAGCPEVFA